MSTDKKHRIKQFPIITAPYCIAIEKSVGALIYRQHNGQREYLLMQYPHGHWEFPRGHMEGMEREEETMFREIEEETGLKKDALIVQKNFRQKIHFSYIARGTERKERIKERRCLMIRKTVIFYLAEAINSEVLLSHEHTHFLWLPFDDALKKLTFENARRVMRKAEQYYKTKSNT